MKHRLEQKTALVREALLFFRNGRFPGGVPERAFNVRLRCPAAEAGRQDHCS